MECSQQDILERIEGKVDKLHNITIEVSNGRTKHITYKRDEFFQMLYDRKDTLKNNARSIAKDVVLFGTVITLLLQSLGVI